MLSTTLPVLVRLRLRRLRSDATRPLTLVAFAGLCVGVAVLVQVTGLGSPGMPRYPQGTAGAVAVGGAVVLAGLTGAMGPVLRLLPEERQWIMPVAGGSAAILAVWLSSGILLGLASVSVGSLAGHLPPGTAIRLACWSMTLQFFARSLNVVLLPALFRRSLRRVLVAVLGVGVGAVLVALPGLSSVFAPPTGNDAHWPGLAILLALALISAGVALSRADSVLLVVTDLLQRQTHKQTALSTHAVKARSSATAWDAAYRRNGAGAFAWRRHRGWLNTTRHNIRGMLILGLIATLVSIFAPDQVVSALPFAGVALIAISWGLSADGKATRFYALAADAPLAASVRNSALSLAGLNALFLLALFPGPVLLGHNAVTTRIVLATLCPIIAVVLAVFQTCHEWSETPANTKITLQLAAAALTVVSVTALIAAKDEPVTYLTPLLTWTTAGLVATTHLRRLLADHIN